MARPDLSPLLADPRFEILPFAGYEEQVEHLPAGAKVAVTASPAKGLDLTVEKSVELAERGFDVTPHVAARSVRDADHLADVAGRFTDAGITDVFVPGGDNDEPAGEFDSAYALLSTLEELGYEFAEVGITGYPEGHQFIDDETLATALARKEPHATYVVTQLCYSPEAILAWIEAVRERGVDLPVVVGVPGVVKYQRLLSISSRVGVGDSIDFLRKTSGILDFVRQLVGSRGTYTPDRLLEALAPHADDPAYDIAGVHLYTFNQVPDTEAWRREVLGGEVAASAR